MCLYNLILQKAFAILKIVDQEVKYVLRVSKFFENLKDLKSAQLICGFSNGKSSKILNIGTL